VERIQNPIDKRKYELTITEKARLVLPDIKKALAKVTGIAVNSLSENQVNELYNMFTVIESNLLSHKS
jgi:DNA-binding MarR family transcriptional regulator